MTVTMLEDDLRKMFAAQVEQTPAVDDAGGVAIEKAGRSRTRRRATNGVVTLIVFIALLSGAAVVQAMTRPPGEGDSRITFATLFGNGDGMPAPGPRSESLPTMDNLLDVRVDNRVFASSGEEFLLYGAGAISGVVRIPAGWLYSDDIRLRLRTESGRTVNVTELPSSSWAVSPDGSTLASVNGSKLDVTNLADSKQISTTSISAGVRPVTFAGGTVVLAKEKSHGSWKISAQLDEVWNPNVLAVFSSASGGALGVAQIAGRTCLVEMAIDADGMHPGLALGCDTLAATAIAAASLSPDGKLLAIPSATGVHLIDVERSRQLRDTASSVVAFTCESAPNAAAYWAEGNALLTVSAAGGIVACLADGTRYAVPLPAGVTQNWELVPSYAVPGQ